LVHAAIRSWFTLRRNAAAIARRFLEEVPDWAEERAGSWCLRGDQELVHAPATSSAWATQRSGDCAAIFGGGS